MKLATLSLLPLLLVAVVLAQDDAAPGELIKKLGHEDYEVREQATKKLIEMGDKAVPALEKALESEDLEVRLRASRALRAIRGDKREKVEETPVEPQPDRESPRQRRTGMNMTIRPGKVTVTVTELNADGKQVTKTYEAASIEELKKKYPELKAVMPHFEVRTRQDGFDMDRFWKDWNKDFDEEMKQFRSDLQRDMERWQRWLDAARDQRRGALPEWALPPRRGGHTLGVRAGRVPPVLDAQLQLRGQGVIIEAVEKDTLAEALGVKRHDVLVELAGKPVRNLPDVTSILRELKKGDKVTAKVYRRARLVELAAER